MLHFHTNVVRKQKTAYEISLGLVGSEMCIRDSYMIYTVSVVPDGPVREIDVAFSYECCTKVEDFRDAVVEI